MLITRIDLIALSFLLSAAFVHGGPVITVKDKSGRAMEVELISMSAERVSFNRKSDGKTFDMALSAFDADSVTQIKAKKDELGHMHPVYDVDVVVDKRRKKKGDSDYLVEQTVATKVTIKSKDVAHASPPATVRVIYLGEDRQTGKSHSVLAVREYKLEIPAGKEDVQDLEPFKTVYDSDNKGVGNIGGDQYEGYLLLIMDDKGTIIQQKGNCAKLTDALSKDAAAVLPFKTIAADARLDANYAPIVSKFAP